MNAEQISILRRHYKAIKPMRVTIAKAVVRGLADAHPKFARWTKQRWTTVEDLNALIKAAVYRVDDFAQFERLLLRWGKRLAGLGVTHDGLLDFRHRWMTALQSADASLWTPDVLTAWNGLFDAGVGVLARPMLGPAPAATTSEPSRGKARTTLARAEHTVASGTGAHAPTQTRASTLSPLPAGGGAATIHELVIRDATAEDLNGMFTIYDHEVLNGTCTFETQVKTADQRLDWLATHLSPKYPALVAVDPRRPSDVLGWASLSPWSLRSAYARSAESSVYVRDSVRGMGVGQDLMRHLVLAARANRVAVIIARVVEGNPASLALHERCGFKTIGVMRRAGEKFGQVLDVRLMDLHLDGSQ